LNPHQNLGFGFGSVFTENRGFGFKSNLALETSSIFTFAARTAANQSSWQQYHSKWRGFDEILIMLFNSTNFCLMSLWESIRTFLRRTMSGRRSRVSLWSWCTHLAQCSWCILQH